MPESVDALEVTVTGPVASFRNPLYAGVQLTLPCPPPATVGGLLAAAAGGWRQVAPECQFAMAFHAWGVGEDLETYHPLAATGRKAEPTPRPRQFLADVTLTVWLLDDVDGWRRRLRRPVWPLRLGRSQDLVGVTTRDVTLDQGDGRQGRALLPGAVTRAGTLLRLPTAVALDRARTRWNDYRYAAGGAVQQLSGQWVDPSGQAVVLLPPTHPAHAAQAVPV
ncbi:CRISPR-associated protein Cas5 [Plantactinospora sp. WMMC1484]|uniref:CRISPR-associated protein Cas5 n=1 Tax=Plantactinospora sp. WMMC1484 TaxID=3404122 RepID=UPI003BF5A2D8